MCKIFPYIPIHGSQVKVMLEPSALCVPYSLEPSAFQCQQVDPVALKFLIPYCHLPMDKSEADESDWNDGSHHIRVVSFAYYLVRVVSFTYSLVGVVSFAYSFVRVVRDSYIPFSLFSSAHCLQLTISSLLSSTYCLQLTIFNLLSSACCLQLSVFSLLSSAYCLQLTIQLSVFSLLSSAYCLQLTIFSLLFSAYSL